MNHLVPNRAFLHVKPQGFPNRPLMSIYLIMAKMGSKRNYIPLAVTVPSRLIAMSFTARQQPRQSYNDLKKERTRQNNKKGPTDRRTNHAIRMTPMVPFNLNCAPTFAGLKEELAFWRSRYHL